MKHSLQSNTGQCRRCQCVTCTAPCGMPCKAHYPCVSPVTQCGQYNAIALEGWMAATDIMIEEGSK